MAKTSENKKKVYVHEYETGNGTVVPQHYRSTPNTCTGPKKK